MKKKLSWLLCIILCVSIFSSGCSSKNSKNEVNDANKQESANVTPAGTFPIVKDKFNLKVMTVQSALVKDYATNALTKQLEDKTNIHIDWQLIPAQDVKNKVNLMLASNSDLPDVFMGCGGAFSMDALTKYGSQKIILPLNSYIDKYGVEWKKMAQNSATKNINNIMSAADGNIYYAPKLSECYNCQLSQKMWIYKPWMDKLGLKMPTTTDEFYNVLKAFKTQDPNGNGKADEVPLIGAGPNGPWHSNIDGFLMCSFIYDDGGKRYTVDNGKVDVAYTKPEWKEGLKYLNKLCKEKLLDPVSFTQDQRQLTQLAENKDAVLLGAFACGSPANVANAAGDRVKDYVSLAPLKGPSGFKTAGYYPNNPQVGMYVITSSCKNPEAAYRLADYMLSDEISIWSRFGIPDTDWTKAKEGQLGTDGKQALLKPILVWGSVQNSHYAFANPGYSTSLMQNGQVQETGKWSAETVLYKATKEQFDGLQPKEILPPLSMTDKESEEYSQLALTIDSYVTENIARFTTGDRNIDSDWDSYIKELNNMGLDRYIKIPQTVYDRQYKNKK